MKIQQSPSLCLRNTKLPMALFWFSSKRGGKHSVIITAISCFILCQVDILHEGGDEEWCLILASVDPITEDQVDTNGVDSAACSSFVCQQSEEQPENRTADCSFQNDSNNQGLLLSGPLQNGSRRELGQGNAAVEFSVTWQDVAGTVRCPAVLSMPFVQEGLIPTQVCTSYSKC